MNLVLSLLAATILGLAARQLNIPGGLILGAMLGSAIVATLTDRSIQLPPVVQTASLIVIGAAIGGVITRSAFRGLGSAVVPAVLAAVLIIVAGIGITLLLRAIGMAPPGDVLATSPGALAVVAPIALEQQIGPAHVAMFHTIRVVGVILSLPLIVRLLPESG